MSESSKYTCGICSKTYKNNRSLASHRYTQHSNSSRNGRDNIDNTICIPATDNRKERESDLESNRSTEPHGIESMDEDESDLSDEKTESDSNSLEDALGSADEYLDDSTSRKRHRSPISQPKVKRFRKSTTNKRIPKSINLANAEKHAKLIKLLSKAILDGTIQLQSKHVRVLKPHGNFVRKIAHGKIKDVKVIIQKEARTIKKTGGSVLKTVLETVLSILPSLFDYVRF